MTPDDERLKQDALAEAWRLAQTDRDLWADEFEPFSVGFCAAYDLIADRLAQARGSEPSDDDVERAARAHHNARWGDLRHTPWEDMGADWQSWQLELMRAALSSLSPGGETK